MCIKCSLSFTNESMVEQLQNEINTDYGNFDKYNTTSVQVCLVKKQKY